MKFIRIESDRSSERWKQCEEIAIAQFKKNYSAEININIDTFITNSIQREEKEEVFACIGYKFYNKNKPFFIEQYFKKPLPTIVKEITGLTYLPDEICELGTMASIGRRDGVELLKQLPFLTTFLNKKVGFVTITKQVQFLLQKINLPYWIVCKADKNKILHQNQWGTYYDQNPVCAFIIVDEALKQSQKTYARSTSHQLELI